MEGSLLSKSEQIHGESSSNNEHILNINTGSSTADEQPPPHLVGFWVNGHLYPYDIDAIVWNLFLFLVTLIQIVVAIVVVILTKDEQQKILVRLIISYTCGSIATLPYFFWRFWYYTRVTSDTRMNEVMNNFRIMVGYFFMGWVTVFLWILDSSLDYTKPHIWLCFAFFINSCIQHLFRNLRCWMICMCLPILPRIAVVYDFVEDIDEKLTYVGIAFVAFVLILQSVPCANTSNTNE